MDMDDHSLDFDSVKAEKANALAKYRRVRNIATLFQVMEVFVALTLISWMSTRLPSAVSLSGKYLIEYSAYLLNPHVVFIIGNVIVAALYMHSRHFDAAESDSGSAAGTVSEEYGQCRAIDHDSAAAVAGAEGNKLKPTEPLTEGTTGGEDKQIVCYENAVAKTECEAAAMAIEKATKQIRRFQRTQSEKLKRQISMKPKKEFRRSETEVGRLVVTSPRGRTGALTAYDKEEFRGAIKSFDTVDRLSNEEFRLRVEAFIEKQQSFLKAQKFSEDFH